MIPAAIIALAIAGAWAYSARRVPLSMTSSDTSEWPTEPGDSAPLPTMVSAVSLWRQRVIAASVALTSAMDSIETISPGYSGTRKTFAFRIGMDAPTATSATLKVLLLGAYPFAIGETRDAGLVAGMTAFNLARAELIAALDAPDLALYARPTVEIFRA